MLDPTSMLARLDQALPLLTGGARDLPEWQRTMEALISGVTSDRAGERIVPRLSVFAGEWDLPAAEAVCGGDASSTTGILDLLSGLVEWSLVTVERGTGMRYRMLEPVRQFAFRLLEEADEAEDARNSPAHLRLAEQACRSYEKRRPGSGWTVRGRPR